MRFGGFGGGSKISTPIEFPARLRLPLSDGRKCEYALTGIVVHLGGSATSGHYTSFVRKPGINEPERWYHMDDSYVEAVSEKTVLKQKDVYLLFYCRIEVKLELPSPPNRPSMTTEEAKKFNVVRSRSRSGSFLSSDEASKKDSLTNRSSNTSSKVTLKKTPEHTTGNKKHKSNAHQSSDYVDHLKITSNHESVNKKDKEGEVVSSELSASPKKHSKQGSVEKQQFESRKLNENLDKMEKEKSTDVFVSQQKINKETSSLKHVRSKAKIIIDRGASHGKLEVMIGPRFKLKKCWKPKTTFSRAGNEKLDLLGTQSVSKWEDDQIDTSHPKTGNRSALVLDMNKQDNIRKKRMHVDRWDSLLDQGKKKKVKLPKLEVPETDNTVKANQFHRIQLGIQSMNRGKAKGFKRTAKDEMNSKKKRSKFTSSKKRKF